MEPNTFILKKEIQIHMQILTHNGGCMCQMICKYFVITIRSGATGIFLEFHFLAQHLLPQSFLLEHLFFYFSGIYWMAIFKKITLML